MRLFFILGICLCFSISLFSQTNQYKNELRHGLWITYYDTAQSKLASKGIYRHGMQKGKWEFYDEEGNCLRREKYKHKKIRVKLFYAGDKIWKQGTAKLELTDSLYKYFFTGEWKCYNQKGELEKKEYYERGHLVNDVLFKTSEYPLFNDSLARYIKTLYNSYYRNADSVTYVKRNYGPLTHQYKRMMKKEAENDSIIKRGMTYVIEKYGYPSKEVVGAEYTTLFFLISSYDLVTKVKFYNAIVEASEKGILSKKDVAFFIDKVKVGKKEPQIYCTQGELRNDVFKYYPVEDKEKLNELRKSVGLEELDLAELKFIKYQ